MRREILDAFRDAFAKCIPSICLFLFPSDVHDGSITSFAVHPDKTQKLCITGGHDGVVKVINYETGKTLHHFKQLHADSVEGVQFAAKSVKEANYSDI